MQNEHDGRNDFDFFIGRWKGHNRRLRERLKACDEWDEFEGISVCKKILGGMGNVEEVVFHRETGYAQGCALRLFDPDAQEWLICWASSAGRKLELPMIGKFKNGRGEFYAQELFENKHVYNRLIWSEITETSCRWEQAFSPDGGKTWETNWIMEFIRLSE
jgi:hypothetical protein